MQKIFGFVLIFTLLIAFSSLQQNAFADTYTIKPVQGSGVPGCEETSSGCFSPDFLTVNKGSTIRFINTDSAAHTITSGTADGGPSGEFDSSMILANGDFSFKLTSVGTVDYFCMVHPWMVGTIIVKDSGGSTYTPPPPTYTPPPSSGIDWQKKYLDVLSDFNDVSVKVGELQSENSELRAQIDDLENTINTLNALIMEQVKVIYDWVIGK